MKIAVIGYSGAGKSTLAKELGEMCCCPVLHLDRINFEPGWKERDRAEGRRMAEEFMRQDSWVIDGNYGSLLQKQRLEEADRIVFMNFSRAVCFYQAYRRFLTFRKQVRPSIADGCEEKFDFAFAKWILRDGRTKEKRESYREVCKKYPDKVTVCRTRGDVRKLMKSIGCQCSR